MWIVEVWYAKPISFWKNFTRPRLCVSGSLEHVGSKKRVIIALWMTFGLFNLLEVSDPLEIEIISESTHSYKNGS